MTTSTTSYDLSKSASHLLHRAGQIAATQSMGVLKSAGLTDRQFALLCVLAENEGVSQSRLVEITGIDRSTLAEMAMRMEKEGFIKRRKSKHDARARSVSMMAKGRRALDKAMPGMKAADAALLSLLPSTRQSALLSGLARLVAGSEEPATTKPAARKIAAPARKKAPAARKSAAKKKAKSATAKKATAKKTAKKPAKSAAKKPASKAVRKKKK